MLPCSLWLYTFHRESDVSRLIVNTGGQWAVVKKETHRTFPAQSARRSSQQRYWVVFR